MHACGEMRNPVRRFKEDREKKNLWLESPGLAADRKTNVSIRCGENGSIDYLYVCNVHIEEKNTRAPPLSGNNNKLETNKPLYLIRNLGNYWLADWS